MDIVFYSTGCPKCKVLKAKLDSMGIDYTVFNNIDRMVEMGIVTVPDLMVDGKLMNFKQSMEWLNSIDRGE